MNQVISELAFDLFGETPREIARMHYGHMSQTYEIKLDGRAVILRTNAKAEVFATTERNLRLLRELGLPVPTVISSDLTLAKYPFAYLATEKIPGRDLGYELAGMNEAQMSILRNHVQIKQMF